MTRIEKVQASFQERLLERLPEIERAALTRVHSVAASPGASDPEYAEGLRLAVSAGFEYGLAGVERGQEASPQIPLALLSQARLAARNGVSLDTVLRRYFFGYTLLGDFLVEEAEVAGIRGEALKRLLRVQASRFDGLIAAIVEEYTRASSPRSSSVGARHAVLVERLLDGELIDLSDLAYDLNARHVGVIVTGPGGAVAVRDIAACLDTRLLLVPRERDTVWAWLGKRREIDAAQIAQIASEDLPPSISFAIGEAGEGVSGWRLTHRQARAAQAIVLPQQRMLIRYTDVALLSSALRDDLLSTSLRQLYLAPLEHDRSGGEVALETLHAYFEAGRNISCAAAALGVTRQTVNNRLRGVEERLDRPLDSCAAELEVAVRLNDFDSTPTVPVTPTCEPGQV